MCSFNFMVKWCLFHHRLLMKEMQSLLDTVLGWSENNFFFEIEKSVVLKTCQTGKIYEKNWFWRVATFGGLATPQNVF